MKNYKKYIVLILSLFLYLYPHYKDSKLTSETISNISDLIHLEN